MRYFPLIVLGILTGLLLVQMEREKSPKQVESMDQSQKFLLVPLSQDLCSEKAKLMPLLPAIDPKQSSDAEDTDDSKQ